MGSAQQYIDIFNQCRDMICKHSSALMNSKRDEAFEAFQREGHAQQWVCLLDQVLNCGGIFPW